mgnify:CR=1 FL=1
MTYRFNDPLFKEPDGTFITAAQLKFFLNREDGVTLYDDRSNIFVEYYDICRVYNLVSTIMNEDEKAAIIYWDEDIEAVSMAFPAYGKVSKALAQIKPHHIEEEEEEGEEGEEKSFDDDDPWGLLKDSPWEDK